MNASLFFSTLYKNVPEQYFTEIRMLPNNGGIPTRLYRPACHIHNGNFEVLAEYNANHNIYHRVALSLDTRSRKQDICAITALWLDIDGRPDNAEELFSEMRYPPTMLVDSGGGWHLYWLLKEMLILDSDKARFEVERTMQGMILDFGASMADPHVKDVTRILRTPSFYNVKPKYAPNYPLCKLAWLDDSQGDRYHFKFLHRHFAPLGAPEQPIIRRALPVVTSGDGYDCLPKRVKNFLEHGTIEAKGRNAELLYCARAYNDCGFSQSQAENDLIPVVTRIAGDEPFSEAEARRTIHSAYRYAPDTSKRLNSKMKSRYSMGDKKLQGK